MYMEKEGVPTVYFDLIEDPMEKKNRIDHGAYASRVAACHEKLMEIMAEFHDDWSKEIIFPPVNFQTHQDGARFARELYARAKVEQR